MAGYEIIWSEKAVGQLNKLPIPTRQAVHKSVGELQNNPYGRGVKKLRGVPYFRLRVGDYRVIFNIDNNVFQILVILVGHRKNIYDKL